MSAQFHQQLREASVLLTSAQEEAFATAVEKLTSANPSIRDQLTRLRLSFGLEVPSDECAHFDEQLAAAGVELSPRDQQLRRTMAAAVLVARFGRPPGRRNPPSLAPDTAVALGARILVRAQRRPVHPDVGAWANYWLEVLAVHLREPRRLPSPPEFAPQIPDPDPATPPNELAAQAVSMLQARFAEFAGDLLQWSSELDPAEVKAQGEQIDLLWWLQGGETPSAVPAKALWAARGLRMHARQIPGPPQADQLLRRRLGTAARETVLLTDIAERAVSGIPDSVVDLCPLLMRNKQALAVGELECSLVAEWLFDELTLVELIETA